MASIGKSWPNDVLKDAFQHLHSTLIKGSINVASVADELFAKKVLSTEDNHKLLTITDDWERCRRLLALLHCSQHPEAFSHLYGALRQEPAYDWLVKKVDELSQEVEEKRTKEVADLSSKTGMARHGSVATRTIKMVAVGDGACGKTTMFVRFIKNEYPDVYIPTVFDNYVAAINIDRTNIHLVLCDTAGQEDYDGLRPLSYLGIDVALVCFDVCNPDNLSNVEQKWVPELKRHCPKAPVILVGTKTDLRRNQEYVQRLHKVGIKVAEYADGKKVGESINAFAYVECSALLDDGVDEVFETATRAVLYPHNKKKKTKKRKKTKNSCFLL